MTPRRKSSGFTLVEVVLAMGIVSFSVLATVGLLSVANDTNKKSRDEAFAAQLAANEFERMRSLGPGNFPAPPASTYQTRYFDDTLKDLGTSNVPGAFYSFSVDIVPLPSPAPADLVFNATVAYPPGAASPSTVFFTTLMNIPKPTPTPTP